MSLLLTLNTDDRGQVTPTMDGRSLAGPTALGSLPALKTLQADAYTQGQALTEALGGQALLDLLEADADRLLLLAFDADAAQHVPWEFAALESRQFLACRYGLLRLVDRQAPTPPGRDGALHFIALAADPLVDDRGQAREGYRLDLDNELRAIRHTLQQGNKALYGHRIAPTHKALLEALEQGPALLHLSCHGNVVRTAEGGEMAVLQLEDDDGGSDPLLGRDLVDMPPPGVLRLVLLSACRTSQGQANLARALVLSGVPAAIGMQGTFPDPLSDELATALYRMLLQGYPLSEALRRARLALRRHPGAAGLPVGYVAREGWQPLPLGDGPATVRGLGLPGACHLPPEVQPPRPLLGRNRELHDLARLYSRGKDVVTVVGSGGMGKTALAAAFAERFAWRWPRGVLALSFAGGEPDAARFRADLLRGLLGEQAALALAAAPPAEQAQAILAARRDWDGLLLLDNYESVLQAKEAEEMAAPAEPVSGETGAASAGPEPESIDPAAVRALLRAAFTDTDLRRFCQDTPPLRDALTAFGAGFSLDALIDALIEYCQTRDLLPELLAAVARRNPRQTARHFPAVVLDTVADQAVAIHRLVFQLAEGGARLLLTSRQHPAQLRGEVVYPRPGTPLPGLAADPAAALFLEHSTKAGAQGPAGQWLAGQIGAATEGHPLAIALLAGEYDQSEVPPADFLAGWTEELATARHDGLAGHHRTFGLAFRRSYDALSPELQARLRALSTFPFPFLVQGAALIWGLGVEQADLALAREDLGRLARTNLLQVEGRFEDNTAATYRFQPALHQAVARLLDDEEQAACAGGYAAYAYWFVDMARGEIGRQPAVARLAQAAAGELIKLIDAQPDEQLARYCWQLSYLLGQFGFNSESGQVLDRGAAHAKVQGDDIYRERILVQQAKLNVLNGDLDRALQQYEEAAALARAEENQGEYSVILNAMANVYRTRGDLDRALALYQESLQIKEQIGDLQGKSASLHAMANVYRTRGDLDRALALYQESLQLVEQIGDLQGKSASLSQVADIHMASGNWGEAERCLQESLAIAQSLKEPAGIAFRTVKFGQVAEARGDRASALACYREGLAIFEQLGMPEAEQVRAMIAGLEGGAAPASDPVQQAIARARAAAARDEVGAAVAAQEEAVALAREGGEEREALVTLSVLLYNLAGYYRQAGRHEDAVRALEEVVALDERTGHPDLESDRQALAAARRLAAMSPEERAQLAAQEQQAPSPGVPLAIPAEALPAGLRARLEAADGQVDQLSPEDQAELEELAQQLLAQLQALSPEERAELEAAARAAASRDQIQTLANQARDGAIAALRGEIERALLVDNLERVTAQAAEGEQPGSPWHELAQYLQAVIALLHDEPTPSVPTAYAAHLAAIQQALG